VDTPAGSVVIGGDATNDVLTQPRKHSTSDQVELLAAGIDVIVHSTMHPVMGPDRDSGMPAEVTAVRLTARGVLERADLAGACGRKSMVSI
jgi:hypothetical protein